MRIFFSFLPPPPLSLSLSTDEAKFKLVWDILFLQSICELLCTDLSDLLIKIWGKFSSKQNQVKLTPTQQLSVGDFFRVTVSSPSDFRYYVNPFGSGRETKVMNRDKGAYF